MERLQKFFLSLAGVGLVICFLECAYFNLTVPRFVTFAPSLAKNSGATHFRQLPSSNKVLVDEKTIPYFTDVPRNQSTVNLSAEHWLDILPYRANATPSDAILMPITGAGERGKKNARKTGFVYSAFLDPRFESGPFVRVLGIIHREVDKLFCLFHWRADKSRGGVVQAQVELQWPPMRKVREHQYWAIYANCPLDVHKDLKNRDLVPTSVSIFPDAESWKTSDPGNNLFVHCGKYCGDPVPYPPPALTFCQKHMYGNFRDVVQLVESLELNAILGFEHLYIYGHSYSKQVECVIQGYYQNESIPDKPKMKVDFLNWEVPFRHPEDVPYLEPETPGNDCFFRNLVSGAEFVANADLDEHFQPAKDVSADGEPGALTRLMRRLAERNPKAGSFFFKRIQFPRQLPDDAIFEHAANKLVTDPETAKVKPRRMRKTLTVADKLLPKVIHIPDRGTGVRTHGVRSLLDGYEQMNVDPEREGKCPHYRMLFRLKTRPSPAKLKALRAEATDRTAHAYKKLLTDRIEIFLKNVPTKCNVTADVWNNDQP